MLGLKSRLSINTKGIFILLVCKIKAPLANSHAAIDSKLVMGRNLRPVFFCATMSKNGPSAFRGRIDDLCGQLP